MEIMKNKKGFTLVELLAVIVILALIMGIAAYSMQGVTENVRISSMKSSALSFVDGVRTTLLSTMELQSGDYFFDETILETDVESPWGGLYQYKDTDSDGVIRAGNAGTQVCGGDSGSFVRVNEVSSGVYSYDVCLFDSNGNFVFASEKVLSNAKNKADYYKQDSADGATVTIENGKIK